MSFHDLMVFVDGLDDIVILKAGMAVIVLLMIVMALLEEKPTDS